MFVVAAFLCVGSYGQDSLGVQTPVDTTQKSPDSLSTSTPMTTQPDAAITQEPSAIGSPAAVVDSTATTEAVTSSETATESVAQVPIQEAPVAEKVVAGGDSAKTEES